MATATIPGSEKGVEPALFSGKYAIAICICWIAIASVRVISTYNAMSLTVDEPAHLACGMEYLAKHVYRLETQHPPLARAMEALGPYLTGSRPAGLSGMDDEGLAILARSGDVSRTVFLMRLGNLPFFILASVVVCGWAWYSFGATVALIATGLFTLLPTVLADAGLATTDMALTATVGAAFLSIIVWTDKPNALRGLLMGVFTALALLSKFTSIGYLPGAVALALVCWLAVRRPSLHEIMRLAAARIYTFALGGAIALLLIWAAYFFSFGVLPLGHNRVPGPEFFDGIRSALLHARNGHEAYLLGQFRTGGWWYYFPVAITLKTPIAFLVLCAIGLIFCLKERVRPACLLPLAFSLGVLLPAMRSRVDIGIRHIEPIYIGLAIVAAVGLRQLIQWAPANATRCAIATILAGWMAVSGAICHPDYLTYFNGLANGKPENFLVDSNYDWGQDLKILAKRLKVLQVQEISLASLDGVMGPEYLQKWYGLPAIKGVDTCTPALGWSVVSPTFAKSFRFHRYGLNMPQPWYEQVAPLERVGTLRLYRVSSPEMVRDMCRSTSVR